MGTSKQITECQRRKKEQAANYLGGKCSICGYNKCLAALQFHHIDPKTKKESPSYIVSRWSFNRVKKELDKCLLVCGNCHTEIHYGMYAPKELENKLLPILNKKCLTCSKIYETKNEQQKFCNQKCYSLSQRKVNRPSKEELSEMLWKVPTTEIAKLYNVSDKAITKWAISYNINKPPRGYWSKKR